MKAKHLFGILIILFFTSSIISCNKDDERDFTFNTSFLKQTQWVGTLNRKYISSTGEHINVDYDAGFIFYTESEGKSGLDKDESKFKYSIDDRILFISDGDPWLNGYWLLIQFDKDKITLENSTGGQYSYKATLTLIRKY